MCLAHCSEYLIAQLACNMAGAACFPLETHFGPQMLQARLDSRDAGRGGAGGAGQGRARRVGRDGAGQSGSG